MILSFAVIVPSTALFLCIFVLVFSLVHYAALLSVIYWYRDKPFGLIGAKAKFMIEVIPMITAAALHHLFDFNIGYLGIVLGCSMCVYTYAHFLHAAYDIGVIDALLGVVMQVLAYMLDVNLLARVLFLSFCLGLCYYRYITYVAPIVPVHRKKELEQVPC